MSRPLTALAAITRLNIIERKKKVLNNNNYVKQNIHICIHLLGCDVIGEGTTPKETYCIFRPLLSELHKIFENDILKVTLLLNGVNFNMEVKSLNITIEDVVEETEKHEAKLECETLTLVYCPGLYHLSELAKSYPPDLLLAFNAGIWGYDDWIPTLKYILLDQTSKLNNVPFVITSYNKLEAEDDEDVLLKLLKIEKNDEVYEGDHNNNNNDIGINVDVDKYCIWSVEENQHADQSTKRPSTHEGEFLTDNAYWMCFIGCRARKD